MDPVYKNFIDNFVNVVETTKQMENEIVNLLEKIKNLINNTLNKMKMYNFVKPIDDYYRLLTSGIGEMAGAMTLEEIDEIFSESNNISIKHIRKIFNAFWAYCKVIITFLIFYGTVGNVESKKLKDFAANYHNGISFFENFVKDFITPNILLLTHIVQDGLVRVLDPTDPNRIITQSHLYMNIIKMPYIGTRQKMQSERDVGNTSGFNIKFLNSVENLIIDHLTDHERKQIIHPNKFPWNGNFVYKPSDTSYHSIFCKNNDMYYVSGRSGSTFELMTHMMILFQDEMNGNFISSIIMYYIFFHVTRGSHSVIEVVLAFYDICEYINKKNISHEVKGYDELLHILSPFLFEKAIIFHKTNLAHELINGITIYDACEFVKYDTD